MALPKQVQAQLAEVEELEKTLKAQKEPKKKKAEKPDVSEKPEDTEAEVTGQTEADVKPVEVKPADTPPTDVADDFKQKYSTLKGKYDAEVPRLHQQIRDLTSKIDALAEAQTKKPDEPTKPKEEVSLVTDADRAEFGEELLDVQRRVAQEVSQKYEDRLTQQDAVIQKLREELEKTGNQVGEMGFAQRLAQLVPDFAQIDKDERWVSWLNEYDPMLNGPRRKLAQEAFDRDDAETVAHYVKLFKDSIAEVADPPVADRQSELEKQVAPSRSASSVRAKSAGENQKVYSAREVQAAWDKIRVLNTRGQYDDAAKLEANLTAAYLEGRVRT